MEKTTIKQRNQINTMLDLVKEFAKRGHHSDLETHEHCIEFTAYADSYEQARKIQKVMAWFADKDDTSTLRKLERNENRPAFYYITLCKHYD